MNTPIPLLPCANCGSADALRMVYDPPPIPIRHFDWCIYCNDCMNDPPPLMAYGATAEAACRDWNTETADVLEEACENDSDPT